MISKKKDVVKSKKQKSIKMKEVSSKGIKNKNKPAEKVKKNLRVPPRHPREPFKTLMISRRQPTVSSEKAYSYGMKKLGGVYKDFTKLDIPGEAMDTPAHKVGMPDRFSSTLYAPPILTKGEHIYYLYKNYKFTDDLTKYDIFRRAAHYAPMIGKRKRATDAFRLAGMAVCANFEVRKRREKLRLRGRWRPEYSNYGKRMMESPRYLTARLIKYGHPYFGQIITRDKEKAKEMTEMWIRNISDSFQSKDKETKKRFAKFRRHNNAWVDDRKKCHRTPMFMKFGRDRLSRTVVNRHWDMPWRRRGDQDLFNEFNFLPSHLAFSAHFCRVLRGFKVNVTKEDEVIQKNTSLTPLVRVRTSRYSHFPAASIVNYNNKDELQTILPRIPRKAPSVGPVSGYSSDSQGSTASDTPLYCIPDWKHMSKVCDHRSAFMGDITRSSTRNAAETEFSERKWREMERRKKLLYKEDGRFELQNTVPILKEITKMHPPFIYCKLKGMELNKLRKSKFPVTTPYIQYASTYLIKQRMNFLEKTLPCKEDPRILLSPGWKVFATRANPETFPNVARILKQRSSWVSKHCMSRAATVPRCDKLAMNREGKNKKLFLILILPLTIALMVVTFGMISFL